MINQTFPPHGTAAIAAYFQGNVGLSKCWSSPQDTIVLLPFYTSQGNDRSSSGLNEMAERKGAKILDHSAQMKESIFRAGIFALYYAIHRVKKCNNRLINIFSGTKIALLKVAMIL
ncbi:hypothetical protein EVAR_4564_1 [Eumeta japonica]|uniref:Uncharacterized protein n=1 Tax=Eumeta variegata TaxID=151549 RepID=A0A4C1SW61_EUMVA|nr:hypothetical protein EVAR_4564_1 [Eumeta japonica]